MKQIGERIRQLRQQKGLSQENMADQLNISTTAYGDIERGKTDVTLSRLHKIAAILGTEVASILGISRQEEGERLHLQTKIEVLSLEREELLRHNEQLRIQLEKQVAIELVRQIKRNRIGFWDTIKKGVVSATPFLYTIAMLIRYLLLTQLLLIS